MITREELGEILKQYDKHGWEIGRVLVSEDLKPVLLAHSGMKRLTVSDSDIDAIWFRRDRPDGDVSWEIRHLSSSPFALCESFPPDASPGQIEVAKRTMEDRIRERAYKRAPLLD